MKSFLLLIMSIILLCSSSCAQKVVSDTEYIKIAKEWKNNNIASANTMTAFFRTDAASKAYIEKANRAKFLEEVKGIYPTEISEAIAAAFQSQDIVLALDKYPIQDTINTEDNLIAIGKHIVEKPLPILTDILKKYVYPEQDFKEQVINPSIEIGRTSPLATQAKFKVYIENNFVIGDMTVFLKDTLNNRFIVQGVLIDIIESYGCGDEICFWEISATNFSYNKEIEQQVGQGLSKTEVEFLYSKYNRKTLDAAMPEQKSIISIDIRYNTEREEITVYVVDTPKLSKTMRIQAIPNKIVIPR